MSKNDIFTDPKYAAVDGNIYHDTIFDNSKEKQQSKSTGTCVFRRW